MIEVVNRIYKGRVQAAEEERTETVQNKLTNTVS